MYSPTRLVIDSQLAPMQIGIRKTVSMISISAMPSMPSAQLKAGEESAPLGELPLRAADVVIGPQQRCRARRSTSVATSAIHARRLRFGEQAGERADQRHERASAKGWESRPLLAAPSPR